MTALAPQLRTNRQAVEVVSTAQLLAAANARPSTRVPRAPAVPMAPPSALLRGTQRVRTGSDYVAPVLDLNTIRRMVKDLGFAGEVYEKTATTAQGLRQYVILKGHPGRRSILTGTRYLSHNRKVVELAIGRRGVGAAIKGGVRLTIFLAVPLDVLLYLLDDQQTIFSLFATLATDVVKIGLSGLVASAFAGTLAAVTSVAAVPIVVAVAAGVVAGLALNGLDESHGITDKLAAALEKPFRDIYEVGRQGIRDFRYCLLRDPGPHCF